VQVSYCGLEKHEFVNWHAHVAHHYMTVITAVRCPSSDERKRSLMTFVDCASSIVIAQLVITPGDFVLRDKHAKLDRLRARLVDGLAMVVPGASIASA